MSQPDLFVVCKNCGSEVSPYVTECPYCGQRVRKRAPKIDRTGGAARPKPRKRAKLPRLRSDDMVGIAPDTRPYATIALVALSLLATLATAVETVSLLDVGGIVLPFDDQVWRWFASPFVHDNMGYQFAALVAVAIFGMLLERRFGPVAVVATFMLAGVAGCALAVTLEAPPLLTENDVIYPILGANGAALGLLCAWLVDDRRAARRGFDRENDLIGVYVIAVLLLLLSLVTVEANIAAAIGGAVVGALMGLLLPLLARRSA